MLNLPLWQLKNHAAKHYRNGPLPTLYFVYYMHVIPTALGHSSFPIFIEYRYLQVPLRTGFVVVVDGAAGNTR